MPILQSPPGAEVVIDGRRYLYFVGTAYLGLQGHSDVIRAACEATRQYGIASATSRGGYGTTPPLIDVEARVADFFGTEGAFCFASGYMGNQILVRQMEDQFDAVFIDEHSHDSLFDAAHASGQRVYRFLHRDTDCLDACLRANLEPGMRPLVLSDGVFSAIGSIAPAHDYVTVLRHYEGSTLLLDDAHGVGVLGKDGRGTLEHVGLYDDRVNATFESSEDRHPGPRLFFSATLSKALGGFGGIIPGSTSLLEAIRTRSPYFNGASPPPASVSAAGARALELAISTPELRIRLRENVHTLKDGLCRMGFAVEDTPVPIVALAIGDAENMKRIRRALAEQAIAVAHLPDYPGVAPDGVLRLAVFATHTKQMIEQLLESLAGAL